MTIENTSGRDPLLHLAGLLDGSDRYITEMESAGQSQLVASTQIPTRGSDGLAALGFEVGEINPSDPMFRDATLPAGWSKQGSDHDMWSYIVDEHGRQRVSVFYKAAFYDRSAFCRVNSVENYLHEVSRGAPLILDGEWATREAVAEALLDLIQREDESITMWTQREHAGYVKEHQKDRAAWKKLLDSLPGGAS